MENINKKELVVSAIDNGTVIDHIAQGQVLAVLRILKLESFEDQIYIGANLESKKYKRKGIIKVRNHFFKPIEINKIALVSPTATIIEIRNYEVVKKTNVEIPDVVNNIVKCFNPKCITNIENVPTKFTIIDKEDLKLHCHYCEKNTAQKNMVFI